MGLWGGFLFFSIFVWVIVFFYFMKILRFVGKGYMNEIYVELMYFNL